MTRRMFLSSAVLATAGCMTGGLKAGSQYGGWTKGQFQIHFIYTGAGESMFLIFPDGTTMLLDCGDFEAGARGDLALPLLPDDSLHAGEWVARYVKRVNPNGTDVDYMLISHFHRDHMGTCKWYKDIVKRGNRDYYLSGFSLAAETLRFRTAIDRTLDAERTGALTLGAAPLSAEIEFPESPAKVTVRPLAKGIAPRTEGRKVRFEITEPGAYAVETGGSEGAFFLFVDPPMDFAVDRKDPKVRYYGPGEHDVGLIELKSGETLFLDEGAVVYGRVFARDADDIRVLGRGILDASRVRAERIRDDSAKDREEMAKGIAVCNVRRHDAMRLEFCDRVRIEGIVIRDAPGYTIRPVGCRDFEISRVKVIGNWRYNSDGFDMHNCRRVRIHDCFLRTFDDTICVKGFDYVMDESHMLHDGEMHDVFEDVRVERCVLWNDWGRTLEIGAETRAKEIRGVTFRNCDLIHSTHAACDIQNVDYAAVRDVTYEDIRIELDDGPLHPLMQRPGDAGYYDKGKGAYLPMAMCAIVLYHHEYSAGGTKRGTIDGVTFRNIRITAPRMPPSLFRGLDEKHGCRNIVMDGVYLNGKRVPAAESNAKAEKFAEFDWRN